ncbi:MAG: ATP-dependent RecD-like DNA helicase [Flavobacteriaceae bacterium]|nr:ATP-dependent RecD-like DNA helicase [Flavobacteriaceae bacterium]
MTQKIDEDIFKIDRVICGNISRFDSTERGLLSQNILSQLRNFVEYISLKIFSNGRDVETSYENIVKALEFVKANGKYRFLNGFHKLLQITVSHYTLDEENSERLMLKYYEYLLKIKSFLKANYGLTVLSNIHEFPINVDSALKEYYEKIAQKINEPASLRQNSSYTDRYYILKKKPFFVGFEVYYEITFTRANDRASKFDRIIAFTKSDISHNYAVKLSVSNDSIQILGKNMPIQIIDKWEVSIRPCEINNFSKILGLDRNVSGSREFYDLLRFLTSTGFNLVEVIDFNELSYSHFKDQIIVPGRIVLLVKLIDNCREIIKNQRSGSRVLRYLLHRLNNRIIKKQFSSGICERLSDLHLEYGCIPFDQMPFNSSLRNHNPRLTDLFECLDSSDRHHELFARFIKNNTELKGQLYTPKKDILNFTDPEVLIQKYNSTLYYKHTHRRLEEFKEHIYINGYEEETHQIISKLTELTSSGIGNYGNSVQSWLQQSAYIIDCDEKTKALNQLFEHSKVALIYGSAGTGKSTMINHLSNFLKDDDKLYLANTNPAVDNLKRKVNTSNCTFKTITKFLSARNNDTQVDLLVIDECSTVSNSDMFKVLEKATFRLLVLVGDVFQIESILFGNWFSIARSFVPDASVFELTKPYRTSNEKLLNLWKSVRDLNEDILEKITKGDYSVTLDESIFEHTEKDEIILCLNYDGLYGINNINKFLQSSNRNVPVEWGIQIYKIDDPILFNETDRFTPLIYNNLKGRIRKIEKLTDEIKFDIELDKVINEFDAEFYDFKLLENSENGNSVIRFSVSKYQSTDEDDDNSVNSVVPFQVAYAVSIHKAQGLEYKSVKIVITDEIEEMITHNIFYTAITRAREKLKIYWTPETENKILKRLERKINGKDEALLKLHFNL